MALTEGLISYWKLDESSGNAADSVGTNTLVNTATIFSTGKINNGAIFNGSTSELRCNPTSFDIFGTANFSYSFWFNCTSLPVTNTYIVDVLNGVGGDDKRINLTNAGVLSFALYDGTPKNATWSGTVSINTWYHVVATYNGSEMSLYVNNSSPNTATATGSYNETPSIFLLGGQDTAEYTGKIDEFGIWSRALTSGEVSQLYANGSGLLYPFNITNFKFRPGSLGSLL